MSTLLDSPELLFYQGKVCLIRYSSSPALREIGRIWGLNCVYMEKDFVLDYRWAKQSIIINWLNTNMAFSWFDIVCEAVSANWIALCKHTTDVNVRRCKCACVCARASVFAFYPVLCSVLNKHNLKRNIFKFKKATNKYAFLATREEKSF